MRPGDPLQQDLSRFSEPLVRAPDVKLRPTDDHELLEQGLATARKTTGWTFVTLPAPVVAASAIVAASRSGALVAWSSRTLTIAGVGAAHELRGYGEARWEQLVAAARRIEMGAVVGDAIAALRPRLLGGVAFAPDAAARTPWEGFGDAWFVLPRWTYIHDGERAQLVLAIDAGDVSSHERWSDELAAFRRVLAAPFAARPQPATIEIDRGDPQVWRAQVRAITDAIARGDCAKIVAARRAVVALAGEARAADLLAQLDSRHTDCVRVLVRPPRGGALIAATPERLVRLDGAAVACDALAGSRARSVADVEPSLPFSGAGGADADALFASAKDRREHDLVVRAIADTLAAVGADVVMPDHPSVRALRHVLHLHTPITAVLHTRRHVLELAAALHPTPAVGGTPTVTAMEWITAHEPTARGWYAAPVGWFDLDGNGELAVAIRSGLLVGDRAHLWAGAGIVAGSDPDRELAETELKLQSMLGALGAAG